MTLVRQQQNRKGQWVFYYNPRRYQRRQRKWQQKFSPYLTVWFSFWFIF